MMLYGILLIWLHFIADFVFQNRWIAENKSTNTFALLTHCAIYTIPFILINFKFAVANGCLHFLIDFCTSRLTKRYYMENRNYMFFVTIGCDQALHLSFLFSTYLLFVGF